MALIYRLRGELAAASDSMTRALKISRETYGENSENVAHGLVNLAVVLRSMGREDEAEQHLQQALAIRKEVFGDESPEVGNVLLNLGSLEMDRCEFSKAAGHLERALELQGNSVVRVTTMTSLANAYRYLEKFVEAEALFTRALETGEEIYDSMNQQLAYPLIGLGKICAIQGRREEASRYFARWSAIFESGNPEDIDWYFHFARAGHMALLGERHSAMEALRHSVDLGCPSLHLSREPDLASLRALPEFNSLKAKSARAL